MARPTRPNSQRYFTFLLFSNYSKFISKRILSKIMKYVLNLRTYLLTCMLLQAWKPDLDSLGSFYGISCYETCLTKRGGPKWWHPGCKLEPFDTHIRKCCPDKEECLDRLTAQDIEQGKIYE